MKHESIDYGWYDVYHGGLDDVDEKITEFCDEKYGYGNWSLQNYDVDIRINAVIMVEDESK